MTFLNLFLRNSIEYLPKVILFLVNVSFKYNIDTLGIRLVIVIVQKLELKMAFYILTIQSNLC
jgi:hypothetical protein